MDVWSWWEWAVGSRGVVHAGARGGLGSCGMGVLRRLWTVDLHSVWLAPGIARCPNIAARFRQTSHGAGNGRAGGVRRVPG